jgi:hypothetical protein
LCSSSDESRRFGPFARSQTRRGLPSLGIDKIIVNQRFGAIVKRIVREPRLSGAGFSLAMKQQNHTLWNASAAIAAVLAISAPPLAAQDAATPAAAAPTIQPVEPVPQAVEPVPQAAEPVPVVAASPTPVVEVPDLAVPAASGAETSEPASEPSAAVTNTGTAAPVTRTTKTTVTRKTSAPVAAPAAPVAAPSPAADVAALPDEAVDTAPIAAAPAPAAEPTPVQTENVIGTLGLVLLGLLALAVLAGGLMFLRRRHPAVAQSVADPIDERPIVTEPVVATIPRPAPVPLRGRDPKPVAGALPSDGAAVDLPATLPETAEARNALFERMVAARPDKANPFTDRRQRAKRARLIMQSLGVTFDHEPRIDLSQYPNNWPELQRPRYEAA